MKIVVAIKQVPVRDSQLLVGSDGHWIQESGLSFEINEPDAYALEEALQLKEKHGGEVIALCAGPARASQTIREALAKGADRAIHVVAKDDEIDSLAVVKVLQAIIAAEKPDLVVMGKQAVDGDANQVGQMLAGKLGWPQATFAASIETTDGGPGGSKA
ncbi:MAG: electron transfer flavoprotein subunit beta/FixA family protein, partial [Pseudomonadota bacterium]